MRHLLKLGYFTAVIATLPLGCNHGSGGGSGAAPAPQSPAPQSPAPQTPKADTPANPAVTPGSNGDGGAATSAALTPPRGLAIDSGGNLYMSESWNLAPTRISRVRRVDAKTGIITTVAGKDTLGFSGDGGAATSAELNLPTGLAVDSSDNLYIADSGNNRIRKVDAKTGIITTIAGNGGDVRSPGSAGAWGHDVTATSTEFVDAMDVAVDSSGNLYIASESNVRKVDVKTGIVTIVAGNERSGSKDTGDGGVATNALINHLSNLTVDSRGNLYIDESYVNVIRKVDAKTGIIATVAGIGKEQDFSGQGFSGDGGVATAAKLYYPEGTVLDSSGNLYIADSMNNRIRKVDAKTGIISTLATSGATSSPSAIAMDSSSNIYYTDHAHGCVRKVDVNTGSISTVAGAGGM